MQKDLDDIVSCPGCPARLQIVTNTHARIKHGLDKNGFRAEFEIAKSEALHSLQVAETRSEIASRQENLDLLAEGRIKLLNWRSEIDEALLLEGLVTSGTAAKAAGLDRTTLRKAYERGQLEGTATKFVWCIEETMHDLSGPASIIFSIDRVRDYLTSMQRITQRQKALNSWDQKFKPTLE